MIALRIRERARAAPDHVAIEHGGRSLTYAELDARARAIAAHVSAQGAGRDDVVVIRSDDRANIVLAMAGVLYAGAAFLVVTADLPEERAQRMARDANARVVLCDAVIVSAPTPDFDVRAPEPRDLAYVVFTSGTTGAPKGVLVTHAGLLPMLDAQIEAFALDETARAAWVLSPLFDASVSDVLTALGSGATLVCLDGLGRLSPRMLFDELARARITHVDLPPSMLALLEGAPPASLRTIVIGGEPCADRVVERVASRVRLVNVYGPTEATVCTSMNVCVPGEAHHARLGMPLPHVVYRVEDGELLIGGPCLARGYAGDPRLDAERFVTRDGQRFYRTGDRVRARASGELEYVGRIDRQVKVSGMRIEPEEIEARLREDARVLDVAVVAQPALSAFVVARGALEDVRAELATKVPRWLVPSRFVALASLPRTAAGKVDYAALVTAEGAATEADDETTRVVCAALASALGRGSFEADEDFVRAGGDSFAALAACAAADAHGVVLSPETITAERTPRRIAASRDVCGMTTRDLDADIARVERRSLDATGGAPRAVFVTGATGTLGPSLVRALVARGCAVTCLVRASDDEGAMRRLRDAFHGDLPHGVRAASGDVAIEGFGWERARFAAFAKEHDAIVHAAADLRLTSTYAALRAANVLGTAHALDFAAAGPMRFHHVSTLSVFASSSLARTGVTFSEGDELLAAGVLHGGYAQSKWAAERLLPHGAHVTRLGLVLPSRRTDLFGAFARAVAEVGCLPDDPALAFDVTPLDFAATALAHFVATADTRVRHVANHAPATLDDLAWALGECGVHVTRTRPSEFRARVAERRERIDALALATIRAMDGSPASRAFDLFETTRVDLGASRTASELEAAGIRCPSARDALRDCVRELFS